MLKVLIYINIYQEEILFISRIFKNYNFIILTVYSILKSFIIKTHIKDIKLYAWKY